jgi:hypothetical protein
MPDEIMDGDEARSEVHRKPNRQTSTGKAKTKQNHVHTVIVKLYSS